MARVDGQAATFGQRFEAAANGVAAFSLRMGAVVGILAAFAIHAATAFQGAQAQVHNFAGASVADTQAMSQAALSLSTTYGESATKIVAAMYDVASAGIRGKEALDIERSATEAAAASHGKLDEVMKAVVTTMLDYPHAFANAHDATGEMTKVVQEGRMHWEDYARSISTVEPLASALGIPFSQLGAMLVQLTRHGNSAQESTMMLRNAIMQTIMPNVQARNTYAALGLSVSDLIGHHANLISHLHALVIASQRETLSERQVADATGYHGIRAARLTELLKSHDATLRLLSGSTLGYQTIIQTLGARDYPQLMQAQQDITHGAQSLDQAWAGVSQTTGTRAAQLRETFRTLGIVVGTILLPAVTAVAGAFIPLGQQLAVIASQHQTITGLVIGAALAFVALGVALKAGLVVVQTYRQGFELLRTVLEIAGIVERQEQATNLLSTSQSRAAVQAQMLAGAQARLRAEQQLAAASAAGDTEAVDRLTAAISEVSAGEMRAAEATGRRALSQEGATVAAKANAAALEQLDKAQAAYLRIEAESIALDRTASAMQGEATLAMERRAALQIDMNRLNNEARAAQRELNVEIEAAGAVTEAERQAVIDSTVAGQRWTAMAQAQRTVAAELGATTRELYALRDQEVVATTAATAANQRLAASEVELTSRQMASAAATGQVVATNEALAVSDTEAAASTGLLATAVGALDVAAAAGAAAVGLLDTALAVLLSPVVIVVAVIAGLVIGFKLLYDHCSAFRAAVHDLATELGDFFYAAGQKAMFVVTELGDLFGTVGQKAQDLTGASNGFLGVLELLDPELWLVAAALQHIHDVLEALSGPLRVVQSGLSGIGSYLASRGVPGWDNLKNSVHDAGDALAATGARMDAAGQHIDGTTPRAMSLGAAYRRLGTSALYAGASIDQSSAEIAKSAHNAAMAQGQIEDAVKAMAAAVDQQFAALEDHQSHYAVNVANHWISAMAAARSAVIGELNRMRAEAAVPIKIAPIAPPDLSGTRQRFTAAPAADTKGVSADMKSLGGFISDLKGQMAKLPPDFGAVGRGIIDGYQQKINAAHADFLSKLGAENRRHAAALGTLQSTERTQLQAEYQRAQAARNSEDTAYLGKLRQINDSHAQQVAQYLQQQTVVSQTSASSFQAAMAEFDNRLNQLSQTHLDARRALDETFHQKLAAVHGKYAADARKAIEDWYNRDKANIETRFSRERANIEWHINHLAQAFQSHNAAEVRAMQDWLARSDASFRSHVAGVNAAHRAHVSSINAAHQRHVSGIGAAHTAHVNKENQVHQHHVDALTAAFHGHIEKIEKALATVSAPGGMWDKLQAAANDLADNAMKKLAIQFLEHGRATTAQIKAVVDAQRTQDQMTAAMKKATEAVTDMGGHAGKAKQSLDSITTQINAQYKKAMDDVTRDILLHGQATAAHTAALQRAVIAQNQLTAAQAKAQAEAERLGAAHKKTADEWVKALADAKSAVDTQFNAAIARWVLATDRSAGSLGKYEAQAEAAAVRQQALANAQAQIAAIVQARLLGLSRSVALAATAFDQARTAVGDRLKMALSAAAQEFLRTGSISASTAASLQRLQAGSDAYDAALKAAQDAAQNLGKTFSDLSSQADERLSKALDAYTLALYKASQGDAVAAASLAQLQTAAVAAQQHVNDMANAAAKAKKTIEDMAGAANTDFNASLKAAQAKLEDAKAALADAIAHGASAASLQVLRQAADDAARQLDNLNQAMKQAEADITEDTGIGEDTSQPTAYQKFEEGMADQKLALQEQNQTFNQSLDTQKESLAQQKLSDTEAKTAFDEQLREQRKQTQHQATIAQTAQLQLQALTQMLAMDNKLLYLSRIGLSRSIVGSGDEVNWLNSLGGQSFALTSAV